MPWHRLVLPCFVLGWAYMGQLSRLVRAAMLDEINADYVRTARAKGLAERLVMRRHVLRNAWLPTLTILGFSFAQLLTASVLTETIFQWNGIGSYAVQAANTLDFPADQRRVAVRRPGVSVGQPHHRRALRRGRPQDPAGMSLLSAEPRVITDAAPRSTWTSPWKRVTVIGGMIVAAFWLIVVFTVHWWAPYTPLEAVGKRLQPPSWEHWLGTDALSRDVFTRTLYGARQTLPVSLAVIVSAVSIGTALGAVAGFVGGRVDSRRHASRRRDACLPADLPRHGGCRRARARACATRSSRW